MTSQFKVGDKVRHRSDAERRGMVEALGPVFSGLQYYVVFWGGAHGSLTIAEHDLLSLAPTSSELHPLSGPLGTYPEFQRLVTLQRLLRDRPLRNNVYAFNASRTEFYPYQFKPLLKFIESDSHRLLICDEVGLGKTIEAGLILLELRARQTMSLVLVACPTNLRPKWRIELKNRFGEDFRILDTSGVMAFLDDYEESPRHVSLNAIVSLETLRTEKVRSRLEDLEVPFDLVIIDEAHHLRGFNTATRTVGQTLSRSSAAVVMLTATPVHLGQENLFSLLNVLDEDEFPSIETALERFGANEAIVEAQAALNRRPARLDLAVESLATASRSSWFEGNRLLPALQRKIETAATGVEVLTPALVTDLQRDLADVNLLGRVLTRTRRRDVHSNIAIRRAQTITVTLTDAERWLYDSITELVTREAQRSKNLGPNLLWRLNTPQRRYASSIQGMVEFYREPASEDADDPEAPTAISVDPRRPEELPDNLLRAEMAKLISAWPLNATDSKYDQLKLVLSDLQAERKQVKILVFASFRHTIRYLQRRLGADGINAVGLTGETPIADRPGIVDRFKDNDRVQVLLSSRVGSEGLDFQFCSTVVNYDLPWNPMEVEQRIGRVDRIGQKSPVISVVNMWTSGTIEERVLKRLYDRIGIFERSVGDLEAILGEIAGEFQRELMRGTLNPLETEAAVERIAKVVEEKERAIKDLEASAASFVGSDGFFDEEIVRIRKGRRYVTADQLRVFLHSFIENEAPRTRLTYDRAAGLGRLIPDERLKTFLRSSTQSANTLNILGAPRDGIGITFDAQVAYARPGIEFFSVLHPLVLAVAEHYRRSAVTSGAYHVRLRTPALPPGFYFFFIYRLSVTAARPFETLEAVFLTDHFELACPDEEAEALLGELMESGETADSPVEVDPISAARAVQAAQDHFLARQNALLERERSTNDAFIDQRVATIDSFFRKKIARKVERLQRGEAERRQERYLRMLRGEIENFQNDRDSKIARQDSLRHVGSEYVTITSGVLEVEPVRPS